MFMDSSHRNNIQNNYERVLINEDEFILNR